MGEFPHGLADELRNLSKPQKHAHKSARKKKKLRKANTKTDEFELVPPAKENIEVPKHEGADLQSAVLLVQPQSSILSTLTNKKIMVAGDKFVKMSSSAIPS